ncbi:S26 family signal peptidase [uncultured Umboniibacter sp.]|uniref:S26 family signal peptidase n=1 Tax=uncultured Umboniibacter sp. TaxID=1798917 RepID=UPI00262A02C8|nr:S26 family signal peptidase [uncultured Umboniibacter sp.]
MSLMVKSEFWLFERIERFRQYARDHQKMSKKKFWTLALIVTSIVICAQWAFAQRYSFGVDPQAQTSIIDSRVFVIDHASAQDLRVGNYYAFTTTDLSPFYPEGTTFLKELVAVPGDHILIDSEGAIWVNQQRIAFWGLPLAEEKFGLPSSQFQGETTLGENQYWFLGNYEKSFDSRYWGSVSESQIIGRAYRLF